MEYVELLRVRRVLISYAVALACCFVIVTLMLHGHGAVNINFKLDNEGVGVGDLFVLGGFGALFVATTLAGSLASETGTLPLLWTKPISRTALAFRFIGIDVLGLVIAILSTAAVTVLVIAGLGQLASIHVGTALAGDAALALGAPLAWYGITLLIASRLGHDGAARASALIWPVFIVLILLGRIALPQPAHAFAVGLEHLDPISYLLGSSRPESGLMHLNAGLRAAACWAIACITIPAAIRLWSTREG